MKYLVIAICLLCSAGFGQKTDNFKDLRLIGGGQLRFRHNDDGVFRGYDPSGVETVTLDSAGDSSMGGHDLGIIPGINVLFGRATLHLEPLGATQSFLGVDTFVESDIISTEDTQGNLWSLQSDGTAVWQGFGGNIATLNSLGLTAGANATVEVGNPTGGDLSFGAPGSVNGLYGLFQEDVHALSTVYGSEGVVVGKGRQDHSHDGSLWIESVGVDGVPTWGNQELQVETDVYGSHFRHNHGFNKGHLGRAFDFDDELHVQKDIRTSGTVHAASYTGSGASLTGVQASDSDLTAIAGLASTGMIARTGTGTAAVRTITGSGTDITVTNGNGVSGNPTIAAGANLAKLNAANTFASGQVQTLDSLNFTKVWQQINASEPTTARFDFDFQRGSTTNADRYFYYGIATNTGTGNLRTKWYAGNGGATTADETMLLHHKTGELTLRGTTGRALVYSPTAGAGGLYLSKGLLETTSDGSAVPGAGMTGQKIRMYGGATTDGMGFGVGPGMMWYNVPAGNRHTFYAGSVLIGQWNATGLLSIGRVEAEDFYTGSGFQGITATVIYADTAAGADYVLEFEDGLLISRDPL